jgi:hypothetical protein
MQGTLKVRCTAPNKAVGALAVLAGGRALATSNLTPSRRAGQDGAPLVSFRPVQSRKRAGSKRDQKKALHFAAYPAGAGEPPSPMPHISDHRVRCRQLHMAQPSAAVEDRSRSRPRQARCGGADGLIRCCGNGGEG